ncbi:homoserine dehydrogenase [Companilactobacillus alimentarius]|uniref:Homoserine dehydrogenase n=1 Tax=Companilactobacillus alimentarius DSM 20249 TaxID=1423720 RepID=A0A2K9HPG7_9LACO|nr:homoserine dehydrogenase [Companilactobacillus alimentarius]AUI71252.1 homoserine dehydrogenase [Companilactobacillus alimentarius DSM 20249]KRK75390.1 homoserine dehydrogenase [Companilactobacillus alimentarius DSM 20249]GEO43827.1 homoserine dehydrogenase [Companilactobacillus alimentarius]
MRIALLGFGTVGKGVYEIIKKAKMQTQGLTVSRILIRSGKKKILPEMTDSIAEIINDDEVDVVVEAIGGIEPAHAYILEALNHQKHVVTANKAVIAKYLKEFTDVANKNHVKFYFEASVGGGIPWIQGLEKALRIDNVDCISGIFNGTSNFILDQMSKNNQSFAEVLSKAQKLGYAENDPSADIDGVDIANKLCISADIAYNIKISDRDRLPIFGIRNIRSEDVRYFERKGYLVKLLGLTHKLNNEYDYVVEPALMRKDSLEANTPGNYNLISLNGETIGKLDFFGQGAGMFPTANAVVQDILDIKENKQHLERNFDEKVQYDANIFQQDYVVRANFDVKDLFKDFDLIEEEQYVYVHQISVGKMHKLMDFVLEKDPRAFMAGLPDTIQKNVISNKEIVNQGVIA